MFTARIASTEGAFNMQKELSILTVLMVSLTALLLNTACGKALNTELSAPPRAPTQYNTNCDGLMSNADRIECYANQANR